MATGLIEYCTEQPSLNQYRIAGSFKVDGQDSIDSLMTKLNSRTEWNLIRLTNISELSERGKK